MADIKKILPPSPQNEDGKTGSYVPVPYTVMTNQVFQCLSDKAARIYFCCLQERYRQQGKIRRMVQENYGESDAKKYCSDDFALSYDMIRNIYGISGKDSGFSAAFKELTQFGFLEVVGRTSPKGNRKKYNVYRLSDRFFTDSEVVENALSEKETRKASKRRI